MPYSNVVGRGDTAALVPEDVANDMLGHVATTTSATLSQFKKVPVMSGQTRFPILSALPVAYWVNGDTGMAQTTEEVWSNKFMNIEEMAVLVPIPKNVLDDVADEGGFDLWSEIMPDCEIAIGRTLDATTFFGTNAPSTFPNAIVTDAEAREFDFEEASSVAEGGIQNDIDTVTGKLEIAGFDPSGIVANRTLKGKLRKARSTIGERLSGVNADITEYMGMNISYPMRNLFPTGAGRAEAFIGDYTEFAVGVRKDISFEFLDQAVLQNEEKEIVINLATQKMVALLLTCRFGWQVSNKIRYDQPNEALRYPVGILKSPS